MTHNSQILKTEVKGKILKAAREKQYLNYIGKPIKKTVGFTSETTEVRRKWYNMSQVLKAKSCQFRFLFLAKVSFRKGMGKSRYSQMKENERNCCQQTYSKRWLKKVL